MKTVVILAEFLGVVVLALTPSGAVGESLRSSPLKVGATDTSPAVEYPGHPCCGSSDGLFPNHPSWVENRGGNKVTCYDCKIEGKWFQRPGHYSKWQYGWNLNN